MRSKLMLILTTLLGTWLLLACQKETNPVAPPPGTGQHVVYPHGAVSGVAVKKTIGAEGGTLATTDGRVALTIPAGAVAKATEFSIQPVENTLPGARNESFRLLPEGTTFAKPVTLRLSYANAPLDGTMPEMLFLAFQDGDGHYWLDPKTTLDKNSQTLTVATTHFSDWQICECFRVVADRTALKVGEKATLKLQELGSSDPYEPTPLEISVNGWTDVPAQKNATITWEQYGAGRIDPAGPACTYTAPSSTPEQNPVTVSLRLANFLDDTDPVTGLIKGRNPIQLLLPTFIEIVTDTYFKYSFEGASYDLNGDCVAGCIYAEFHDGKFFIRATTRAVRMLNITIENFPGRTGQFAFVEDLALIDITKGPGLPTYATSYGGCHPNSPGGIIVTKWAAKPGEYVEGTFNTVVYSGKCGTGGTGISGRFRVKRDR